MSESIFEPLEDSNDVSAEILAASSHLHPEKPETLESKKLVPYFESCGMAEDHIVPGGLREYTDAVLKILGLPATVENLERLLDRTDVKTTLKSAIAAANKVYDTQNAPTSSNSMPNMDFIRGVDEQTMMQFVQKAEQETAVKEAVNFSPVEKTEEPLEDKPEKLPEADTKKEVTNFCPRCGWMTGMSVDKVELTDADKAQFVYSIMQRLPFRKTYYLFNKQMSVTFRSQIPEDKELILDQGREDLKQERYPDLSALQYWSNLYEMALLLEEIKCPTAEQQNVGLKLKPQFKEFAGKPDALREYTSAVMEYVGTEALMRLISEHYKLFEKTYSALVEEALDENFYHPA